MKRRVILVVIVGLALVLTGCDFFTSLLWPPVSIADAKEAWGAVGVVMTSALYDTTVQLDNGSDPNYVKYGNPASTVFYEARATGGGYPITIAFSAKGFTDATTGYTLTGSMVNTVTALTEASQKFDFDLSHDAKPVRSIQGTLTVTASTPSGTLKFNNDDFSYADFSAAP